jgi:hypothetical protein
MTVDCRLLAMRSLAHPGYATLNIAASALFAKFGNDDEREALPPPPPATPK